MEIKNTEEDIKVALEICGNDNELLAKLPTKIIHQIIRKDSEPIMIQCNPLIPKLLENEQILWYNVTSKGLMNKQHIIDILTNMRVIGLAPENHVAGIMLLGIADDVLVMNSQSVHQSNRIGNFSGTALQGKFAGVSSGTSYGSSHQIGDVVFMSEGERVMDFRQVSDPHGIANLAKYAIKELKNLESEYFTKQDNIERTSVIRRGSKISEITCPKCKNSITPDSDFCNHCGTKIRGVCSKCGHENPNDSAFCNKCGFTLK